MTSIALNCSELLFFMPQAPPFRFVDEVLEVDESHIVGRYTFRSQEFYYRGHFPDMPVTPGVILLESMAQCALVLQGLYLLSLELPRDEIANYRALFTEASIAWHASVSPGQTITIRGDVLVWRRRRIRSRASIHAEDGGLVAMGEIAGMGVQWPNGS
jgi:3-hydroxyacyl-[acyl-carrier-protein] dehydratase